MLKSVRSSGPTLEKKLLRGNLFSIIVVGTTSTRCSGFSGPLHFF